jgi:16S rRNA (cytosine1402-N4)-methyltransferase
VGSFRHRSVLAEEALSWLAPRSGGTYLDGTVGGGGHAAQILAAAVPGGLLIGFDRDLQALAAAAERLAPWADRCTLVHGNFADLDRELDRLGVDRIDGLLLDLGVSSPQLDAGERGFSFLLDGPLDMRMDRDRGATAADLVNDLSEVELTRILREFGEERWARRIAVRIVSQRAQTPFVTTRQLADLVAAAVPRSRDTERIHPATRTFQALRIAVNRELESLEQGLTAGLERLRPGGRAVVIAFHSLEDRIVKNLFRSWAAGCTCPKGLPRCACGRVPQVRILTRKPVTPGPAELAENPRARSARLRAAEKL